MSSIFVDKDRKVIPRWRDSKATAATGELDFSVGARPVKALTKELVLKRLHEWEANPTVGLAGEAVSAAVVSGSVGDVRGAAEFLLRPSSRATASLRRLAGQVLGIKKDEAESRPSPPHAEIQSQEQELRGQVRWLKGALEQAPRNSVLWVDLSRVYAMLGQLAQAKRSMEIGLKLAPSNRFVLRSATRLFVHAHEADRGHDLLRSSVATRHDPWLLAAELSSAAIAGRVSKHVRGARQILDSQRFAPMEITELASAMATLHLEAGDVRIARKLFRQSLDDPTENTVAQAEWAGRRIEGVEVDPQLITKRRSYEAQSWKSFQVSQWKEAVDYCELWLGDEPFSSRPVQMGSYLATVALEDFERAQRLAALGLLANPRERMLLNNLVVALANRSQLAQAWKRFREIDKAGVDTAQLATLLATEGLLNFRSGDHDRGRSLYLQAVTAAEPGSKRRAMAALHLAREEILAGTSHKEAALELMAKECVGHRSPDVLHMKGTLERRART